MFKCNKFVILNYLIYNHKPKNRAPKIKIKLFINL